MKNSHSLTTRLCMLLSLGMFGPQAFGGCIEPQSDAAAFAESAAVAEFRVISTNAILDSNGMIQTKTSLATVERFKGDLPDTIEITTPGGRMGKRTDHRSDSIHLTTGKTYVMMMNRDRQDRWVARPHHTEESARRGVSQLPYFRNRARGPRPEPPPARTARSIGVDQGNAGVPGSVVTATGYSETGGQPTRFPKCDGGDPIGYLIDIDPAQLPNGMTQAGAVAAVADAMNAWASSSSLKFRYEGTVSFGIAASDISTNDQRLRIQLHDSFGEIANGGGVLGIGGGRFQTASEVFSGGKVLGQGFQERLSGYVVLESKSNAFFLTNIANFKRVLTHEIGHALGLEHSSENLAEPNSVLKAATMYFSAAPNSTGTTIQAYDVDRIQFGYPITNTPPYCSDRFLQAVTTSNYAALPAVPGVNRINLFAVDRQGTALTPTLAGTDAIGGSFSLSGNTLIYLPNANYSDFRLSDAEIEDGFHLDQAQIQFSDGVNLSRAMTCTITGTSNDSIPSDGLPNSWLSANFGGTFAGAVGSTRHPDSDPDGDGLINRTEFYLNTNPNDRNSGPVKATYDPVTRKVSFAAVRFAPYRVESSVGLVGGTWTLRRLTTTLQANQTLDFDFSANAKPVREFYRILTGP